MNQSTAKRKWAVVDTSSEDEIRPDDWDSESSGSVKKGKWVKKNFSESSEDEDFDF